MLWVGAVLHFVLCLAGANGEAVDVHLKSLGGPAPNYVACGDRYRSTLRVARDLPDDGAAETHREGRIVKGSTADTNDMAFMAAIMLNGAYQCNGFIFHPRFIMTHATCYPNLVGTTYIAESISGYTARTGSRNVSEGTTNALQDFIGFPSVAVPLPISSRIGDWGMFRTVSDIVDWGFKAFPICLGKDVSTDNQVGVFAGWGTQTKSGGSTRAPEDTLRKVDMKILKKSFCNTLYKFNKILSFTKRFIFSSQLMMCAHTNTFLGFPVEGPCDGDQGGPLFMTVGSQWTAVGVFSDLARNDDKCGMYFSPPIFTTLSLFVDPIVAIVTVSDVNGDIANAVATQMATLITTITGIIASALG